MIRHPHSSAPLRRPVLHGIAWLATAIALAGCVSMAPHYRRPAAPVPAKLVVSGDMSIDGAADAPDIADIHWRQVFVDDRLQQVVALALEHNRDLRVAVLEIEKARAQYRIQRASLFPLVNASASQTATRTDASATGASSVVRSAALDVGISSWELDMFGRVRSLKDAALDEYFSTAQAQRATRLSLVAEVANAWLTLAADRERLALAERTLASQSRTEELTRHRHAQGMVSGLDVAQVRTGVERARVDAATYATRATQSRSALDLLLGTPLPDALLPDAEAIDSGIALAPLPARIDSQALLQRPDVLAAEHTLRAANADIGAARAAFFPRISLSASAGRGSDALSSLFDAGARTWSFVPTISVPIFRAGALKAELDVARIQKDVTVARYERSIQSAFREAADALAARALLDARLDAQRGLVVATRRSHALAVARYRSGVDSYLEALDAQRALYSAEQEYIGLRLSEASNRIDLYKVLGGGADAVVGDVAATPADFTR